MTELIRAEGVWKGFPRWSASEPTLRAVLSRRLPVALQRRERRWAVQDVSLSVSEGEAVGVVGHNGAGKSTLLRLAAGVGRPTRGRVQPAPGTAAMLSLWATVESHLSGRENAATTAVVLGVPARRCAGVVEAALAFAGLEDFGDAPLRAYSDGMRLRLMFGVLAQVQPRMLVVDEVLAVGDAEFQVRCLERIAEMRGAGAGLLMASHDLGQVVDQCDRAVWLHHGKVRAVGPAADVVGAYRDAGRQETLARTPQEGDPELGQRRFGSQELLIAQVSLSDRQVRPGGSLAIELVLEPRREGLRSPQVIVEIKRARDELLCLELSTAGGGARLGDMDGPVRLTANVPRLDLAPGQYIVCAGVYPPSWEHAYDYRFDVERLHVEGQGGSEGVLQVPVRWEVRR